MRVDKYTHTRAVLVIGQSGHVKMVLVVCGFSNQSKDTTTVVLGVFVIGSNSSFGGGAHQLLLYHFSFVG